MTGVHECGTGLCSSRFCGLSKRLETRGPILNHPSWIVSKSQQACTGRKHTQAPTQLWLCPVEHRMHILEAVNARSLRW